MDPEYVRAPSDGEDAGGERHAAAASWWPRKALALLTVGTTLLVAGVLLFAGSDGSSDAATAPASLGEQIDSGVLDVLQLFPTISTVDSANKMLSMLPAHNVDEAVFEHMQPHADALFQDFLDKFGTTAPSFKNGRAQNMRRSFDSGDEYNRRFEVFQASLRKVIRLNAQQRGRNPSEDRATFGITHLSDWTNMEFKTLLGLRDDVPSDRRPKFNGTKAEFIELQEGTNMAQSSGRRLAVPCSRNWVDEMPEVFVPRSQGPCGSCWAHSVAEEMRAAFRISQGVDPGELSVEYLVDCDPDVQHRTCSEGVDGCCGGWPTSALSWVARSGGIPRKVDYGPYVSNEHPNVDHPCIGGVAFKATLDGPYTMHEEGEMASKLCAAGPLGVAVWANSAWQYYTGGVLRHSDCDEGRINHAVQAVAVDASKGAWVIRNSWGKQWGVSPTPPYSRSWDGGFILLKYGENACQIETEAVIPRGVTTASGRTHGQTVTTTKEPDFDEGVCDHTCRWDGDGVCDDGGPGATYAACEFGTDCSDCGPRESGGCTNTCRWHDDGECDDKTGLCKYGTDCTDCGPRK